MERVPKSNSRLTGAEYDRRTMQTATQTQAIPMTLQVVQTARAEAFRAPHDRVASRELGLKAASGGMFSARRVKADGNWSVADIESDVRAWLTVLYVLDGWITLRIDDRAVTLRAHDAICQAPIAVDRVVDRSPLLEFIEIQAHDDPRVRALMPEKPPGVVALDAPALHVKGTGPRDFFDYRDLGLADVTNRQVEIQVIRAQRARQGGTGWHSHTMAQLSYGLSGWASLGVEGVREKVIQEPGDALSIPANCVHNADSFSDDYWALQVQIPADYDTSPRDAPRAAND